MAILMCPQKLTFPIGATGYTTTVSPGEYFTIDAKADRVEGGRVVGTDYTLTHQVKAVRVRCFVPVGESRWRDVVQV